MDVVGSTDLPINRPPNDAGGVVDSVALGLPVPGANPAIFGVNSATVQHIDDATRPVWHRVAIHLSAGCRLVGRPVSADAEDVEAIIAADGSIAHAIGPGSEREARESLREAAKQVDRARTREGRSAPVEALELWQGLFAGRWSLVEHFDSDGKRFMLARRNDPDLADPVALSRRQRQVAFYASMGLTNQEIGYALGLAENTVSAHLTQALSKLGIATRAELVRVATDLAMAALAADEQKR
jgi:DNA-binding CsgD family transcriptional regulator